MAETARVTPAYERPPVVETVLGVQFDRLEAFTNAHLGGYWRSIRELGWDFVADAALLQPQQEQFGAARWGKAGAHLRFSRDPSSRLQIRNAAQDRMIQVQSDRFHFNWLGQGGADYPRYSNVRSGFVEVFQRFIAYLHDEGFHSPRPNQWEVTYVNHIPKGTVWELPADWCFFRPLNSMPSFGGLIEAESFGGEWHFVLPDEQGRLHIRWQHAFKQGVDVEREQESIHLTLTARGAVNSDELSIENILAGLDLGHDFVVCSFAKCMSGEANNYWGLKNAADLD